MSSVFYSICFHGLLVDKNFIGWMQSLGFKIKKMI